MLFLRVHCQRHVSAIPLTLLCLNNFVRLELDAYIRAGVDLAHDLRVLLFCNSCLLMFFNCQFKADQVQARVLLSTWASEVRQSIRNR